MRQIQLIVKEAMSSVLPIAFIVLFLSITVAPLNAGVLVMFLFGTLLLILGMGLFTIGSNISMEPLGNEIGKKLSKTKKIFLSLLSCLTVGILITVAEPDLQVLAEQIPSVPNIILIIAVAGGVGIFLVVALLRSVFNIPLSSLLIFFYTLIIILSFIAPADFIAVAFDSGGVTTGPITVPFIMTLGVGMAAVKGGKKSDQDSFGLVSLCSIGPILSVLLLSIFYKPSAATSNSVVPEVSTTAEAFNLFISNLPKYCKEVLVAFMPIIAVFLFFELFFRAFGKHRLAKICVGFLYTYVGLVLFLIGANVGFMPAGKLIGSVIAAGSYKYLLIPIGMIMGYFVVSAEPAVHTLKKQVEEVTNGAISQKSIGLGLSIGVAISVSISMLRVLLGIPILPFLIVGYIISLSISFFVPSVYTGIAFDSGGVASGPMTTTFILPLAVGACETVGGNIMTDAFGIVAMVAMTPLITIQVLGLIGKIKHKKKTQKVLDEFAKIDDVMIYY